MTGSQQRGRPPHNDILTPAEWRVVEGVRHGLEIHGVVGEPGLPRESLDAGQFSAFRVQFKSDRARGV